MEVIFLISVIVIVLIIILMLLCKLSKKLDNEIDNIIENKKVIDDETLESYTNAENELIENNGIDQHVKNYSLLVRHINHNLQKTPIDIVNEDTIEDIQYVYDRNPLNRYDQLMLENLIREDPNLDGLNDNYNDIGNFIIDWKQEAAGNTVSPSMMRGANKKDKIKNYIDRSTKVISDTQNVHDTSVNEALRKTYNNLKNSDTSGSDTNNPNDTINALDNKFSTINEIEKYLNTLDENKLSIESKERAKRTLNHIRKNGNNLNVASIGENTNIQDILHQTWNRTKIKENSDNADSIKEAIVDNLSDCVENNDIVCAGGISARILSSLQLLDTDSDKFSKMQTASEIRSELFKSAHDILNEEIKTATESGDEKMKEFGKSFEDTSIDESSIPQETKDTFYKNIENKVDEKINEYDKDIIPNNIKNDIMNGVKM
jgi:hypothetical protein